MENFLSWVFRFGLVALCAGQSTTEVRIDSKAAGLTYDGHGGLSAGASSRLLFDYPESVRSEILDYLFKPKFGANLWVCKVEIGGDTQSTDGTEPSHMHDRDDLNCTRGYEFWLMKEAKKRNPDIITYGLPWGAPGWINNQTGYYGPDQITYQVNWLKCARDHHGIDVDWLGLWNERPWGTPSFVKSLRAAMDSEGLRSTKLVLGDGGMPNVLSYQTDAAFMAAFDAVGLHYPCAASSLRGQGAGLISAGKKIWASEDWWTEAEWGGAACWAKLFNQNFIRANLTSTISWSTIWSVYPQVDVFEGSGDKISGDGYWGPGLMYAWQPWSGHYVVPPTVWATAHTTQFVRPGWKMLHSGSGNLAQGGSYLTMVSPDGGNFSTIIETAHAACAHCNYQRTCPNGNGCASTVAQTVTLTLEGALASTRKVQIWHTTPNATFQHSGVDVAVAAGGQITLDVQPESMYTVSSTSGQSKGSFPKAPAESAPFPAAWKDDFEGRPPESVPQYWADQCGSFQVMPVAPGGGRSGQALRQRVSMRPGHNKWAGNLNNPLTALGDPNASAPVSLSVDARVPAGAVSAAPVWGKTDSPVKFAYTAGRIYGGDWQSRISATLAEAEAACSAEPRCGGFTFTNPDGNKAPQTKQVIWLTSRTTIQQPIDHAWFTYLVTPPRPPPPPPPSALTGPWVSVCGRVTQIGHTKNVGGTSAGVCLQVNASSFRVESGGTTTIAQGPLGAAFDLSKWHTLGLSFEADHTVSATVDGKVVVASAQTAATRGMVALGSGWHEAEFDNFVMQSSRE